MWNIGIISLIKSINTYFQVTNYNLAVLKIIKLINNVLIL